MQGFTLVNPQTGEAAVASEGQEDAMTAALEIVGAMEGTGLMEKITTINVDKTYDIELLLRASSIRFCSAVPMSFPIRFSISRPSWRSWIRRFLAPSTSPLMKACGALPGVGVNWIFLGRIHDFLLTWNRERDIIMEYNYVNFNAEQH